MIATLCFGAIALLWFAYVYLVADSEPLTFNIALSIITATIITTGFAIAAGVLIYGMYWAMRRSSSVVLVFLVTILLLWLTSLVLRR